MVHRCPRPGSRTIRLHVSPFPSFPQPYERAPTRLLFRSLENVDIASGWQWYSAEQEQAVYGSASCHWKGLGVNNTQNATIRNNPAGGTQLWIESFSYTAESGDAVGSA